MKTHCFSEHTKLERRSIHMTSIICMKELVAYTAADRSAISGIRALRLYIGTPEAMMACSCFCKSNQWWLFLNEAGKPF